MERVIVSPETQGLGVMLAELVRGNLAAHPERSKHLDGASGKVNVRVTDADVEVGLLFTGGELSIGSGLPDADLVIECASETLLALSNVPLRFGMPDTLTAEGRRVAGMLLSGELKIKGIPRHLKLLTRVQQLFSVR